MRDRVALWGIVLLLTVLRPVPAVAASPVPVELYAEIDHGLRPAAVLADPVAFRGRTLLLGGTVERTVSEAGGVTLTLNFTQLDADDRPAASAPPLGTVVATGTGLDGARLQPGRQVTLVATVAGWADQAGQRLPRLEIRFIHAWPTPAEEAAARPPVYPPGYWCDPWWYDPWCDPWYWGPYPRWRLGVGYHYHRHHH